MFRLCHICWVSQIRGKFSGLPIRRITVCLGLYLSPAIYLFGVLIVAYIASGSILGSPIYGCYHMSAESKPLTLNRTKQKNIKNTINSI